jgi:hypothetical protein
MTNNKKDELRPDTVLKCYWRQKNEFADFFNAYLFSGEEIIKAVDLVEMDTDTSSVLTIDDTDISVQGARDNMEMAMSYDGVEYALLGVEDQEHIHYALPFKIEGYDVTTYDRQYKQLKRHYADTEHLKGNELMSGIKKNDKFTPVITVVVYFGSEPWDGPTCLYDMLNLPDKLKPFVNNFKVNLVEVRDNNLVFHNQNNKDLFTLLKIIYDKSSDRRTKREQIEQYEANRTIDKSVRRVIASTSKVSMKIFENEEDVNVCKIWDEIKEDGREEGRKDGRAEEIICFGIEEGWSKEKILSRLQTRLSIESERAEEYYNLYSNKMVTV